jgi:serine/threonine protein kinase/Tol biopolymer transport system component
MTPEHWRQIEDLYRRTVVLSGEERAVVLAEASPGVRQKVEAMLARPSGSTLIDSSAWANEPDLSRQMESVVLTLKAGAKLGPYEVLARIGAGGMGEVYQARDTRLNRIVAIKILPPHLADSAESRDRFEREARMIASLNHPNICTLHDVGHHGDMDYLVMEFLEGETLASRLVKGRLPLEQTLQYGIEIAGALDKAHRIGMTHRDLKPGNIMLTKSGAKLLDFGLAKLKQAVSAVGFSPTRVATAGASITARGAIVGTLQYMAPEQLEGKETDARTDIFALGGVLYEMATGKKAFEGQSQASIMAKILETDPPPIRSLLPTTPAALDRMVRTCLSKDPDHRLQSAQDLKLELEWMRDAAPEPSEPGVLRYRTGWRRALPWALFGATALVLAVFAWRYEARLQNVIPAEPVRLQIPMPAKLSLRLTGGLALSPDGRQLAFIANSADGIPRVWVRALNSLAIRALPGTESVGALLFWSPDSRFIAFDSAGKLQKMNISDGAAETICSLTLMGVGGSWNQDGVIVFGQFGGPIMRVSAAGGIATPVTVLDNVHGDVAHTEPYFLPDGRHFMYVRDLGSDAAISVGSLDAKPEQQDYKKLIQVTSGVAYVPSSDPGPGQMLFTRKQTLLAQPFDARHLKISGDPVGVIEDPVAMFWDTGAYSVSANGTLAYWSPGNVQSQLTWFDAEGKVLSTVGRPGPYGSLALSPDGLHAIVSQFASDLSQSLWLLDVLRGTTTRFDLNPSEAESAVWAPDGRRIIFGSIRTGQMNDLYQMNLNGAANAVAVIKSNEAKSPLSWSPDGRFLLYDSVGGGTKDDLWVLPLEAGRKPVPFLRTEFDELDGRFSPDGRHVAYVSDESGRYEVYVRSFSPGPPPSPGESKSLISEHGGSGPMWRQDGKELYYLDLEGKLMGVSIAAGSDFQSSGPKALFQAPPGAAGTRWAPSPDGKRFLFLVPEAHEGMPLTVVLNWQAGLKKQ